MLIIAAALLFTALLCLLTLKWAIWIALTTITFTLLLQPLILFALLAIAGAIGYFIYRRRTGFKFNQFRFNQFRFLNHRSSK